MRKEDIKFSIDFLKKQHLTKSVNWALVLIEVCSKRKTKASKLLDNKFKKCKMYVVGTYNNKIYNAILFVKLNSPTFNELENSGKKQDLSLDI